MAFGFLWLAIFAAGCQPTIVLPPAVPASPTVIAELRAAAGQTTWHTLRASDSTAIDYARVLPAGFDPDQPYPILLALPPGAQDRAMVEEGLAFFWRDEAIKRGWVVISPVAPGGVRFYAGAERYLPELIAEINTQIEAEGVKWHLAGVSNGGVSAFQVGTQYPQLFHSLLVLPGYPQGAAEWRLAALADLPIAMFVGENDADWRGQMELARNQLHVLGGSVTLTVVPGDGHILRNVSAMQLFDWLDGVRRK